LSVIYVTLTNQKNETNILIIQGLLGWLMG
jgi:hypothetical protein